MHPATSIRALLVEDDQPGAVRAITLLDDGYPGLIEVVQVDSLHAALDHLTLGSFDVVLFGLSLTADPGFKALSRVLVRVPDVPVIVLALGGEVSLALQTIKKGAQDFWLSPGDSGEQLLRAILSAMERKSSLDNLVRRANYDRLTGLPNRYLFEDRLRHATAQAERHERPLAVLYLDIDQFKAINDTLGHRIGDLVLKRIAERITGAVRRVDTVARIGGDEFAVILESLEHVEDASVVAQKVLNALAETFAIRNRQMQVTASIGISLFLFDGTDAGSLLDHADRSMYRAKRAGGNSWRYFTEDMGADALKRYQLLTALRRGLARDEFRLVYQPQVDLATGQVCGIEALLRWQHPQRGVLTPDAFIAIAEDNDIILLLGQWVLREACKQSNAWRVAGLPLATIGVNVSARQLLGEGLRSTIAAALKESGLPAAQLEIELREAPLMAHLQPSMKLLDKLRGSGVRIALDDFGDSQSAIGYLRRLPFATVKLDQKLIRDVGVPGFEATIALALISLAHGLGLKVIAEGVETADQLAFLREGACDAVQGYLICEPLGADEMTAWLAGGPNHLPAS